MIEKLLSFIEILKKKSMSDFRDESSTKQAVILRLLAVLGWDIFNIDEVKPESAVEGGRVDYSLRIAGKDKVFIEVKKAGEDLENHVEQLLSYSFKQGVRIAILSNGFEWWFYLPLNEGSWEQRKFFTIDIFQQESKDVISRFSDFLLKNNVANGKALENAEAVYKGHQKNKILKDSLPKAWLKLITEPDERLISLVTSKTEELCGYKPDIEIVEQFLLTPSSQSQVPIVPSVSVERGQSVQNIRASGNYTNINISAFVLNGEKFKVRTYKDLLMKMCEILHERKGNEYDKVLDLRGRKRPYFTRNMNELKFPGAIKNTGIFVETNFSANQIVQVCMKMLVLFGYTEESLKIEA